MRKLGIRGIKKLDQSWVDYTIDPIFNPSSYQCDFVELPIKKWGYFHIPRILSLTCFGQEDTAKMMMCRFWVCTLLLPLRTLPPPWQQAHAYPLKEKRLATWAKLFVLVQAILDQPAPSWPTRWPQTHEQAKPRVAKSGSVQQNPPSTHRQSRNYKLLF